MECLLAGQDFDEKMRSGETKTKDQKYKGIREATWRAADGMGNSVSSPRVQGSNGRLTPRIRMIGDKGGHLCGERQMILANE